LGNSSDSPTSNRERRKVPRYTFVATVELGEAASAMRLSGRVTEISRHGCYVDIQHALPIGTLLDIQISRDQGFFVAKGKILYVQERIGLGIAFLDPTEDQMKILDSWITELPPEAAI
jgi:hypothetical protein